MARMMCARCSGSAGPGAWVGAVLMPLGREPEPAGRAVAHLRAHAAIAEIADALEQCLEAFPGQEPRGCHGGTPMLTTAAGACVLVGSVVRIAFSPGGAGLKPAHLAALLVHAARPVPPRRHCDGSPPWPPPCGRRPGTAGFQPARRIATAGFQPPQGTDLCRSVSIGSMSRAWPAGFTPCSGLPQHRARQRRRWVFCPADGG